MDFEKIFFAGSLILVTGTTKSAENQRKKTLVSCGSYELCISLPRAMPNIAAEEIILQFPRLTKIVERLEYVLATVFLP